MKYTTVIFDFDGTILDSEPGIVGGMLAALKKYGIEETAEVIRGLIGPPLSKTIVTRYGLTPERRDEIMAEFCRFQFSMGNSACSVYEGVPEMLARLRQAGVKLGIATNKPCDIFEVQIDYFNLRSSFDAIETNNEAQTRGSKSEFVRWAMNTCGSTPAQTLMVGDRANDIRGGIDNGTDTIGVLYGYGNREELEGCAPTFLAATPAQVADLVLNS